MRTLIFTLPHEASRFKILAHTDASRQISACCIALSGLSLYGVHVMLYFAYGSNINLDHLHEHLSTHGVKLDTELQPEHAILPNYRLRTNYFAGSHSAGACNIEPASDHRVEGVVITITPAIQAALRVKEGYPRCYEEFEVDVHTASAQAPVQALTYIVATAHQLEDDLPVTARYRELILTGAKHFEFTNSYQEMLRNKLQIAPILRAIPIQG